MLVADMTLDVMRDLAIENGIDVELKSVTAHSRGETATIVTENESYKVYQLAKFNGGHPIDRPDEFMVYVCGHNPFCTLNCGDAIAVLKAIQSYESWR